MRLDNAEEIELAPSFPILLFPRSNFRELRFRSFDNAEERYLAPS